MLSRKKVAVVAAELIGTAVLTFVILAIGSSPIAIPYFVAIGVGLTLGILVLTIGGTSGAHVNPAVTLGLWTVRKIKTVDALFYIAAQFLGAVAALGLYNYLVKEGLPARPVADFDWHVLVAEVVGTFIFTFGIAAAVFNKYEGGKKAAAIGGSLAVGVIIAGVASNAILNPAAALGVQLWQTAYIAGPVVGSIVGMNLYVLLFAPENSYALPSLSVKVTKPAPKKAKKKPATKKKK